MEKYNKLFGNITQLIEKGLLTSKDLKKDAEGLLKFKMEIIANKLNLVSREEFEVQKKNNRETAKRVNKTTKSKNKKEVYKGKEILTLSPCKVLLLKEMLPP